MKTSLSSPGLALMALLSFSPCIFAQDTAPASPSPAPSASASPAAKPGVYDFQDLPINDVLRDLGRQAKITLTIGGQVQVAGTITFHAENKTPLQVIEAIAEYRNLLFKQFEGNYYVVTDGDWRGIMRDRYYFEIPELPAAVAKYEKRYYDALVKEGFTKDEALKIIMAQPLPPRDSHF